MMPSATNTHMGADGNFEVNADGVFGNVRQLIDVIDELRDVGVQQYINLPRICVVGTQSAGKSSVLEGIVGLDFLPRGDGIVTRRPLELRLEHVPHGKDGAPEPSVAVFEGDTTKYTDFERVRQRIEQLTDEVAGKNKGIVDVPIVLNIGGTNCPDLTLVDLPGITRVPLRGSDQTDDIERLTREMAGKYARDPRTIILAVVPANQDISTSDALQLARRVDPRGLRTIGVITKLDLMDRGTNAVKMITGEEVPLRLGYVAVKNRAQQDIIAKKSIKEALQDELNYFRSHALYKSLPPHMLGMSSLIDKLTKVLFRHIRHFLPEIKSEISQQLRTLRARLQELGEGVPCDAAERTQLMWTMINDYCDLFGNTIRGKYDKRLSSYHGQTHQDQASNCGGAQIRSIFNDLLEGFTHEGITKEMTDSDIDSAIRMHEGDNLPGFPSTDTFEYLILPYLKKIHYPVMECLDRVSQCLEMLAHRLATRVFCRFPALSAQILDLTESIIVKEREHTRQVLETIVNAETGYLFTNDDRYLTEHGSMLPMTQDQNKRVTTSADHPAVPTSTSFFNKPQIVDPSGSGSNPTDTNLGPNGPAGAMNAGGGWFSRSRENVASSVSAVGSAVQQYWVGQDRPRTQYSAAFLNEIRRRLDAYFSIVLHNIRDTVPKTVGFYLVRAVQGALQFALYNALNKAEKFDALLGEPPHVRQEREEIARQVYVLQQASNVLQRDPAIAALTISEGFDESFDWDLNQMLTEQQATGRPAQPAVIQQPLSASQVTSTTGASALTPPAPLMANGGSLFGRSGLFDKGSSDGAGKRGVAMSHKPLFT